MKSIIDELYHGDLSCHETQEYFHMGFCIGALFLLEVMQFKERLD